MNSNGPGRHGVVEEALRHRQVPDAVVHVLPVVETVEELVVLADGVDLGLHVAQFVDRLHLAGDLRADSGELAPGHGETAVRGVFQRRHAGQEQLQRVDVARVGDVELAVVLRKGVDDRIELALLLGLVFPVGVHGQAEGILPLAPVVNVDALEFHLREQGRLALVAGLPAQITGEFLVFLAQAQALVRSHVRLLVCNRSRYVGSAGATLSGRVPARTGLRPRPRCRRAK